MFLGGIFAYYKAYKFFQLARIILKTETTDVVNVREGFIELKGKIEPIGEEVVKTPIEKNPALQYHTMIERYESYDNHSTWTKIWEKSGSLNFLVNDGTGKIKVDPRFAEVEIDRMHQQEFSMDEMSESVRIFIEEQDLEKERRFHGRMRYIERFIPSGENVYVLGTGTKRELEEELEKDPDVVPYTITGILNNMPFVITDKPEFKYYQRQTCKIIGLILLGTLLISTSIVFILLLFTFIIPNM
jgi:hypothetical protein